MTERKSNERSTIYPESDGKPVADNTRQFQWISTIVGGLDAMFAHDPNVFVAGDLFWYPVQYHSEIRYAPDALVVFGRPKIQRGSYRQWLENNIPPQVVFEILSPSNTPTEMADKLNGYDQYGVEEYYIFNPEPNHISLEGYIRQGSRLVAIPQMSGWSSPRLGITFDLSPNETDNELIITRPDRRRFVKYSVLMQQLQQQQQNSLYNQALLDQKDSELEDERLRAEQERLRAEQAELRAEQAEQERERERQKAEKERLRAERLQALLEAQGINLDNENNN